MATTAKIGITEMVQGQSGGEALFNAAVHSLEAMLLLTIEDRDLTAPPGSPNDGEAWIVGTSATGDWATHDDEIAIYYAGWTFVTVTEGMRFWVSDEDVFLLYDGSSFLEYGTQGAAVADLSQDISASYVEAEVQAISDKVDELLGSLRTTGIIAT